MSEQSLQTYLPFHQKSFWEDFYKTKVNETLNWYFDITKLEIPEFSVKSISKDDEVLVLGPGNSSFLDYLNENDYDKITIIDFSEELIKNLQNKYKDRSDNWEYYSDNIVSLDKKKFEGGFDIVIDKGCIDCILSDPKNAEETFIDALNFVKVSLADNGVFYYFSYGKLEERVNLLFRVPGIKYRVAIIDMNTIGKDEFKEFNQSDNIYYLYIITKT